MRRHSSYMCPIGARRVAGVISARIGVAVSRILAAWWKREAMRRMSSQEICIGVNRLHRFRSRRWGPRPLRANCVLTLSPVHDLVYAALRARSRRRSRRSVGPAEVVHGEIAKGTPLIE